MKKFLPLIIIFSLIISIYPIWLGGEALSFENYELRIKNYELGILNPNSHPQTGDNWTVSFETTGIADLTITPTDQQSIDDLDFISLKCGDEQRTPQILENDVIFYPNWFCLKEGQIVHIVNVARAHYLKFQFGDEIKYAYNSPDNWVSPTGHADPSEEWLNETNAYDENEGNWASSDDAHIAWLELTLTTPISCDKIRIMAASLDIPDIRKDPDLKIEVYYGDAWHEIFVGEITKEIWVEKAIGTTQIVSKAQIKWTGAFQDYGLVYEFDFNEVAVGGYEMASDSYRVWQSSINVGGHPLQTSTSYRMRETIGEIATGLSTSTLYKLFAGYQPMQEVYLALSAPSQVSMSPSIGGVTGGQSNGTATTTVITDSPSGYSLSVRASSSPAMATSSYSFADYIPATAGTPDYTWSIPATSSEFGFTSEGSNIVQKFLDNGSNTCNTGSSETTDACWYNFSTSDETIAQTYSANHPNGTQTIIKFKAESGTSNIQAPGEYQATITITAIPN